jgi:hypothetical protein
VYKYIHIYTYIHTFIYIYKYICIGDILPAHQSSREDPSTTVKLAQNEKYHPNVYKYIHIYTYIYTFIYIYIHIRIGDILPAHQSSREDPSTTVKLARQEPYRP